MSKIANELGLDLVAKGNIDAVVVEFGSFARGAARARLANLERTPNPTVDLLRQACRESLHPGKHQPELDQALKTYTGDPLWPALARHLARQSTPADRALLIDLAQHPEKREPPLQWGLQYIVRGDILMPDLSIRPLDDFFTPYGVEPPAYLDDMPSWEVQFPDET